MTPLEEATTQLHEWYTAMLGSGFSSEEAMSIIAKCIIESQSNA